MSQLGRWVPRAIAWLLVPALGVALRLVPVSTPGNTWVADAAGHYRLVAEQVEHGRLPDPDPLTDLPNGRSLGRYLPLGLYSTAAAWHRAVATLGSHDLGWSLSRFTALAGALIAWPVWIGARALGAGPWGAAVAALFVVLAPAHVQRTTAFMLRYDALGTTLVAAHVLLGAAALAARSRTKTWWLSVLSGLGLIAALAVWRVPLLVPGVEALAVACLALPQPPSAALRIWIGTTAIALVIACVSFEYLRAQSHLGSAATLVVVAIALVLQVPALVRPDSRAGSRAMAIVPAILGAAVLATVLGRHGDYELMGNLLRHRLASALGQHAVADPLTGLMLSVKELGPMPVQELWGSSMFSWPALWLLAAPIILWFRSGRSLREWARRSGDPLRLLALVTAGLVVLSLLAMRHRILLAPVVASLVGACLSGFAGEGGGEVPGAPENAARGEPPAKAETSGSGSRKAKRGGSPRRRASTGRAIERLALAAFVLCFVMLLRDAWSAAARSVTRLDPGMSAAIAYLRDHGERGPVLSSWDRGYEIQRYAGCATFSDGLLESEVNQKHIIAAARAFLARTPDSLAALCERFGIETVIVPPSASLYGETLVAGDPIAGKLRVGTPVTPEEADRVLIRMMLAGKPEPPFEPVFAGAQYRVYRRVPGPPPVVTPSRPLR